MPIYHKVEFCRSCFQPLPKEPVFALGDVPVVEFPEKPEGRGLSAPLNLVECTECELVQLQHTVEPELLFRDFWYRSGVTESMRAALSDIVESAKRYVSLDVGDAVLDIGTNDGTLLTFYDSTIERVGFEPAIELAVVARGKGLNVIPEFFNSAHFLPEWRYRFKVITAIAMFYDLDDPGKFLEDVKLVLHPDGIFIVQMNYLGTMLKNLCVDNICHEHLAYYSVRSFHKLLELHGMTLVGVEMNNVNGGSARFYIQVVSKMPESVNEAIIKEPKSDWDGFLCRLYNMSKSVVPYLQAKKDEGKWLGLCGASTRGLILLHFLGLGSETFFFAGDRDPAKWGRFYGATGIPIMSEAEARLKSNVMLVLPWHFSREIIEREHQWIQAGGELVLPLPEPQVVTSKGTVKL